VNERVSVGGRGGGGGYVETFMRNGRTHRSKVLPVMEGKRSLLNVTFQLSTK
jgi:hypothetical protein